MKKLAMLLMLLMAVSMGSHHVFSQSVTITLMPGWNWISCPMMDTLDFETAMGSFTPVSGDIIKSRWGQAIYNGNRWMGTISQFYPGYGYMYKSNRTMPVMVTFNAQPSTPQIIVTTAEPTEITANSAVSGGSITSNDGNYVFVLEKGICWATHPNPMVMNDSFTQNGNGPDDFTAEMTDLTPNTEYYVRAFAVTVNGTFYGEEKTFATMHLPTGAINGLFSVSETQQVFFSQGNLQYQASTNTWRFATNQWDYIGDANSNISSIYSGWIDLFGWGTSGYNHGANCYQPWSTSTSNSDYYAYGNWQYNLYDETGQADWGFNAINNGENTNGIWRTLTWDEWNYVLFIRNTMSGIRFAKATVNEINGIIILPDTWNSLYYTLIDTNDGETEFSSNIISEIQWPILQNAGAVFLPAGGFRRGISVMSVDLGGVYWSSSNTSAAGIGFDSQTVSGHIVLLQSYGLSVRLVQDNNP